MKTDNKTMNKTEYAEMVRSSIDSRILSEAANHTFEKRRSTASTWAAAACFTLIFAAAAILLIKPMTERGQAAKGTPAPEATKTAQTTPDACFTPVPTPDASFTPVPTPDISNMRLIYGSGYAVGIDDIQHQPGTVTLYGRLTEMLDDEQYNNCVFAVHIDIQDYYLDNKRKEERNRLYEEFQNDPAVVRYNELYESFVRENSDRYGEFLELYYSIPLDHQTLDDQLEELAEKYDESMVFSVAFGYYLESTEQEQIRSDYVVAQDEYTKKLSELWRDWQNRPEERGLLKARHEAEVQRLKDCGLISKEYVYDGKTMLYWLLTRDQLLNFPASPEFAYIITPAVKGDDTPYPTEAPDSLAIYKAQAEHIINLLAEYHAAQFTRSAQLGELKLSDNVLSDLEERQRCIEEMEKRIGKITRASAAVEWIDLAPTYDVNGSIESFTGSYLESANVYYGSDSDSGGGSIMFDIMHTVTIAPDGTVLHDYFSEADVTGFSNSPLLGSGIIWTDALVPDSYYTSERYQYLAAANALLAGEVPERTDFSYGGQYVQFTYEGEALKAFVTIASESGEETYIDVAILPKEVSTLAFKRLIAYGDKYLPNGLPALNHRLPFDGLIGENWFALVSLDDIMQDLQVHCIFYFDGSEWREITGNNGSPHFNGAHSSHTLTGACVLDENTALLCYSTKWVFAQGSDDSKVHIYRTENGGESWSRLDIELPDYYTNRRSYYAPLTPVFDESGQHGVIILDSGIMANGESAPFGWLESLDGGVSWEFHSLEG